MPGTLSQRLLTLLQLTRMALVFTAIADALCGLLLWETARAGRRLPFWTLMDGWRILWLAAVSIGLYGFGMSLNDIIDRRRDRQISPNRPIPSGRVSTASAHFVCFGLLALALLAGALFRNAGGPELSLPLIGITLILIWFYDSAGKYLVGPGLLTLGLVRFVHAMIPALQADPSYHPLIWHPLWLLNHVAILSAVCYGWEEKRPALNRKHWAGLIVTLLMIDSCALWFVGQEEGGTWIENLRLDWRLAGPALVSIAFILLARTVRRRSRSSREAGQANMLYGLLWLIAYDACFAALYVHWAAGVALLMLLPLAYGSVQMMRWWSRLVAASQRPEFQRAS